MYNIIIPTYRRKETLNSLINELTLFRDFFNRILVIVQEGYYESDLDFVDVYQFDWANASKARNIGNELSQNEWNLFLDDDIQISEPLM
jgi:glycosyltransferase involved in cell wall biosynthesis